MTFVLKICQKHSWVLCNEKTIKFNLFTIDGFICFTFLWFVYLKFIRRVIVQLQFYFNYRQKEISLRIHYFTYFNLQDFATKMNHNKFSKRLNFGWKASKVSVFFLIDFLNVRLHFKTCRKVRVTVSSYMTLHFCKNLNTSTYSRKS